MKLIRSTQDVDEPTKRVDVAAAGEAILAATGVDDPTEAQFAAAYAIAAAQQETVEPEMPRRVAANNVIAQRANALLATRKVFQPTESEFLAAVNEVAIELGLPAGGVR